MFPGLGSPVETNLIVRVHASPFEHVAQSTAKKDTVKVGIGAAIGTAVSAITAGGTRLSFRLQEAVTLTEKLNN